MTTEGTPAYDAANHSYANHLQLDTLLSVMRPVTTHPEEHLFLTTHHTLELWFKQMIFDTDRIIDHIDADEFAQANWLLERIAEILKLAEAHWTVIETMSAADFSEFRGYLTGASGMQSPQFRALEVMIGLCETAGDEYVERTEALWPGLTTRYDRTLRQAFFDAFKRHRTTLLEVYEQRWAMMDLFRLAEGAFEIDRRFQSWRHNHILMVRRQIGVRARGTGGTFFDDYLAATTRYYFFPELFEFRNELTVAAGGEVLPAGEDD